MSTVPTDPATASADDAGKPATGGKRPSLQQRFEESRLGRRVISGIIVVIIGTQVVWSMPYSAIKGVLMPIVEPANVINVNEGWTVFAPETGSRVFWFEVDVIMADGSTRVWKREPNPVLEKIFLPDRWPLMVETAIRQQDGRREFARWVVDRVTEPSENPVKVVMLFNFKVLAPPGQPSRSSISTKVLYEETLTGPR
jgi:hypothetical protein